MINHCTIYRKDTGQIVQYSFFSCPDDPEQIELNYAARLNFFGQEDHAVIKEESDAATQYVSIAGDRILVVQKPQIPYEIDKTTIAADGVDFLTISGLHTPCEVVVDDPDPTVETVVHIVEGGSFEFEADTPGLYFIEISRFPFLPARLEITAT